MIEVGSKWTIKNLPRCEAEVLEVSDKTIKYKPNWNNDLIVDSSKDLFARTYEPKIIPGMVYEFRKDFKGHYAIIEEVDSDGVRYKLYDSKRLDAQPLKASDGNSLRYSKFDELNKNFKRVEFQNGSVWKRHDGKSAFAIERPVFKSNGRARCGIKYKNLDCTSTTTDLSHVYIYKMCEQVKEESEVLDSEKLPVGSRWTNRYISFPHYYEVTEPNSFTYRVIYDGQEKKNNTDFDSVSISSLRRAQNDEIPSSFLRAQMELKYPIGSMWMRKDEMGHFYLTVKAYDNQSVIFSGKSLKPIVAESSWPTWSIDRQLKRIDRAPLAIEYPIGSKWADGTYTVYTVDRYSSDPERIVCKYGVNYDAWMTREQMSKMTKVKEDKVESNTFNLADYPVGSLWKRKGKEEYYQILSHACRSVSVKMFLNGKEDILSIWNAWFDWNSIERVESLPLSVEFPLGAKYVCSSMLPYGYWQVLRHTKNDVVFNFFSKNNPEVVEVSWTPDGIRTLLTRDDSVGKQNAKMVDSCVKLKPNNPRTVTMNLDVKVTEDTLKTFEQLESEVNSYVDISNSHNVRKEQNSQFLVGVAKLFGMTLSAAGGVTLALYTLCSNGLL